MSRYYASRRLTLEFEGLSFHWVVCTSDGSVGVMMIVGDAAVITVTTVEAVTVFPKASVTVPFTT